MAPTSSAALPASSGPAAGMPAPPDPKSSSQAPLKSSMEAATADLAKMTKALNAIDAARDVAALGAANIGAGRAAYFEFPTIVVIGNQSVGKSSVLENLSRINLPKKATLCTRVPLELCMRPTDAGSGKDDGHAEIRYTVRDAGQESEELYYEFQAHESAKYIEDATQAMTGGRNDIISDGRFIRLTVYGHSLPPLTLVDLPGIVYSTDDDQEEDLTTRIKDLVKDQVRKESNVVLVVKKITDNLNSCEAYKFARTADEGHKRTIVVSTRADDAQRSGDLEDLSAYPSLLHFAVRNRTADEAESNESFDVVRQREREFFDESKVFDDVDEEFKGIDALAAKLGELQHEFIIDKVPDIKAKLMAEVAKLEGKLEELGDHETDEASLRNRATKIELMFLKKFEEVCVGNYTSVIAGSADVDEITMIPKQVDGLSEGLKQRLVAHTWGDGYSNDLVQNFDRVLKNQGYMTMTKDVQETVYSTLVRNRLVGVDDMCVQYVRECARAVRSAINAIVDVDPATGHRFPAMGELLKESARIAVANAECSVVARARELCAWESERRGSVDEYHGIVSEHIWTTIFKEMGEKNQLQGADAPAPRPSECFIQVLGSLLKVDLNAVNSCPGAHRHAPIAVLTRLAFVRSRIFSGVCTALHHYFLDGMIESLRSEISKAMSADLEERGISHLMRERKKIASKRKDLTTSIKHFMRILRRLPDM